MEPTFRKSMAWLHTWAGLVIGSLLFAVIWMGTLSVFDREIDRWMMPQTRLAAAEHDKPLALDAVILPIAERLGAGAPQWSIKLPTERAPTAQMSYRNQSGETVHVHIDPVSGAALPDPGTHAGTGFIFPFHYGLHIKWFDIGYWLVGLAGMSMLVLLVSGVIVHKKIFAEFFTFRSRKQLQRSSLDLHNMTGVLALPFHFVMTLSGLIIFFSIYFPTAITAAYQGDKQAFNAEALGTYQRGKANRPGTVASLDAAVTDAERRWKATLGESAQVDYLRVIHPGDANAYIEVRRVYPSRKVTMNTDIAYYSAADGALLKDHHAAPVRSGQSFLAGLHFIQFEHWPLRWLYFLAGLSSCVMIATGFLFWLEARRAQHARKGLSGVRVVEALTVGSVAGIVVATLAFFIVNRLLPLEARFAGLGRAALEMWAFYGVWLAAFAHGAWRARAAWLEQTWVIAGFAVTAVALNWVTTGDHLLRSLERGLWSVAGMDGVLLLGAGLAAWTARRLQRRAAARTGGMRLANKREPEHA